MPNTLRKVQIFVASPGDVLEERNRLGSLVEELNRTIALPQAIFVELVRWETHARPGFGADAQDVINQQLGFGDIFVGIMWSRVGTRTKRAFSGTIEEFERALDQWHRTGIPKILMYFKVQPVFPKEARQAEQLKRVVAFHRNVERRGGLCWEFSDTEQFVQVAREHLTKEIQEIARQNASLRASIEARETAEDTPPDSMWPALTNAIEQRWHDAPRQKLIQSLVQLRAHMINCQGWFEKYRESRGRGTMTQRFLNPGVAQVLNPHSQWQDYLGRLEEAVIDVDSVLSIFSPKARKEIQEYYRLESAAGEETKGRLDIAAEQLGAAKGFDIDSGDLRPSFEVALLQLDLFIRENFRAEEVYAVERRG